jgi:hypothetical protein
VIIFSADSKADASVVLSTLPMVEHGAIEFDVYQLSNYDHYARLFKEEFKAAL